MADLARIAHHSCTDEPELSALQELSSPWKQAFPAVGEVQDEAALDTAFDMLMCMLAGSAHA